MSEDARSLAQARWLTQGPVRRLLDLLARDGDEARAVGGAVRNALLGEPVREVDIATTAVPDRVIARAEAAGHKAVPTGIAHGTVTVIIDGSPFEVTTLREDVETFGRKAKVRFGRDWRADAERRDFTINALSADRDGTVYDYVGGLTDLAARRVRFIGDAETRIREDYLRILRFFRFHAAYGNGAPDFRGRSAAIRLRDGLDTLSRERIRAEIMRLLVAPGAAPTLGVMADDGVLLRILGGIPRPDVFAAMTDAEAACGAPPDAVRRLAALAVSIPEDATRLAERLRLSNAEALRLHAMADGWWRIAPSAGPRPLRRLLYELGPDAYRDRLMLAWARSGATQDAAWTDAIALPQRWTPPASPFRAADFIAKGIPKGVTLGKALALAEANWIAADFPGDHDHVEAIAARAIAAARP